MIDFTTDTLSSTGGIALVGKILEKIGFGKNSDTLKFKHPEILKTITGLFVQGRTRFEEITLFRDDEFFQNSFDLDYVPAATTLRLYLEQMISEEEHVNEHILYSNIKLLKTVQLTAEQIEGRSYLPVDIDTSPLDNSKSHKEGVSRTYKGFDGFNPIFGYIGLEGYLLDCQLREGKQHCQKETPDFLRGLIKSAEKVTEKRPLLFRLDSGNDSKETMEPLINSGHYYLVKRNLRKEKKEYWLDVAQAEGEITYRNTHKVVYTGVHTGKTPGSDPDLPPVDVVFEVTERFFSKDGTMLLFPEIEVQTFWTNLYEPPETVIDLYHKHGTSEQFHSELKTDMNIERLPSGKFKVNAMLLQIAMIAFNTLRFIGQKAIQQKSCLPYETTVLRKRLRKVIDDLIRVAVKVVRHSRQTFLKLWENDPWLPCFRKLYTICCNL
jgi:hypothetical protein